MTTRRIETFVSAGVPFKLPSGDITILPMQVIADDVYTIIRIGDNAYFFDHPSGRYDGPEFVLTPEEEQRAGGMDAIASFLIKCKQNRNCAPPKTSAVYGDGGYFDPASAAGRAERAGWPKRGDVH